MRAGDMRHRVVIDEPVATQNATGEEIINWTPWGKVWAAIDPINGRERLTAGQIIAECDTRIRIRWSMHVAVVNAKWRIRHQDTVYNIVKIAHVDLAQREIELLCASGVNDG